MDEPRKRLAGLISGLDIHYDLGEGHPLLGRRMPDLDLVTADGPLRVFELLHDAGRCCSTSVEPATSTGPDRVQLVDASYDGEWELPVLGAVSAPDRRADPPGRLRRLGGRRHRHGTRTDALATWFGSADAPQRPPHVESRGRLRSTR